MRYVYKVGSVMFGIKQKKSMTVSVTFVVDTNSENMTDPTLYTYLVLVPGQMHGTRHRGKPIYQCG